jgi:hypothetical protein
MESQGYSDSASMNYETPGLRSRGDDAFNPVFVMAEADITTDLAIVAGGPNSALRIYPRS